MSHQSESKTRANYGLAVNDIPNCHAHGAYIFGLNLYAREGSKNPREDRRPGDLWIHFLNRPRLCNRINKSESNSGPNSIRLNIIKIPELLPSARCIVNSLIRKASYQQTKVCPFSEGRILGLGFYVQTLESGRNAGAIQWSNFREAGNHKNILNKCSPEFPADLENPQNSLNAGFDPSEGQGR